MYTYNYNMPNFRNNMRYGNERFGGFFAPLILGGVAGYAIGNNTNKSGIIYPLYPQYSYYYPPYPYYYPYNNNSNNNNYYYY